MLNLAVIILEVACMRLGAPVFEPFTNPEEWLAVHKKAGYGAAYCPVGSDADAKLIADYAAASVEGDLVIAEVGAWSNPLSPDPETARAARDHCRRQLELAEAIGARCCVNIAGSRGAKWDGPSALDYEEETFHMIVRSVQDIIDSVGPARAFYTLETMPWMAPDSTEGYFDLIKAIDREQFAVHFDAVNLVSSPYIYYHNDELISEFVRRLGPAIRSCHLKDIILTGELTVVLREVAPGKGELDYKTLLTALSELEPDTPLMVEHLQTAEEYAEAIAFIRAKADSLGLEFLS